MLTLLSIVIDATLITLILALAAFGLAIIYGLIGVINLGHGAMLTLGAYLLWSGTGAGCPFVLAVLLAGTGVAIVGLAFEYLIIRHFYENPFETLLLTWGFFLLASEVIKLVYGTELLGVGNPLPGVIALGDVVLPAYRTAVAAFSLVVIGLAALVFYRTKIGLRIRAVTQNPEMAEVMGLDTTLIFRVVFTAGAFLAGIAGAVLAPLMSIDPYIGNVYLIRSFFVVIVGGIGQLLGGTLIGSFFIGGSETLFAIFTSQTFAQTVVFAIAIVIIRFRPQGVFKQR
jgi:urea transport system permease protein